MNDMSDDAVIHALIIFIILMRLFVVRTQTVLATGLLKTPRLLRLLRVARRIDQYSEYGASVLLLMMATFTLFAHWLACGFYALARYERPSLDESVGYLNELARLTNETTTSGPDIRSRYITSLYFTFTIMTSVGFGNVAPVTNIEKVFSIFAMILGCEWQHRTVQLKTDNKSTVIITVIIIIMTRNCGGGQKTYCRCRREAG